MKTRHDEYVRLVARDTGYSRELVDFVINNFWKAIRFYLANPLKSKKGILITGFGRFLINPKKVERYLEKTKDTSEFYSDLLKQLKDEG